MKITRDQQMNNRNVRNNPTIDDSSFRLPRDTSRPQKNTVKISGLCGDCDALNYCQLARNLSHNHGAHLNSHRIINGFLADTKQNVISQQSSLSVPDQHILAEKLKLRYQTCPFHRELSLG